MIINADAIQWAKEYEGELFHALICDPPYHLQSLGKPRPDLQEYDEGKGNPYARQQARAGFMGKTWDGGDVAFQKETWEAFYNILHPGAFGMAFGGSRTTHRMAVAIEDAGFVIHPQMSWIYATGFPKATRIDTQIDKAAGVDIKRGKAAVVAGAGKRKDLQEYKPLDGTKLHNATTDLAKQWEGHRYGLQALKPAGEPIIVFQKPYEGRPIDSITETGAGAINIDGGRIGHNEPIKEMKAQPEGVGKFYRQAKRFEDTTELKSNDRWPANFVLTHSHDCQMIGYRDSDSYQINRFTDGAKPFGDGAGHEFESEEVEGGRVPVWECVDGCPVRALDRQSGHLTSGTGAVKKATSAGHQGNVYGSDSRPFGTPNIEYGDSGGASRFFHQSHWAIENADPFVYQAKVAVSEREAGLLGRAPCLTCGELDSTKHQNEKGELVDCKRCGHPTLKPIALIEHLATLLLPPKEYAPRRIVVPFAGVASEMIGCWRAGWEEITGIEIESEYAEIGKARLEYWKKQGIQLELFGGS